MPWLAPKGGLHERSAPAPPRPTADGGCAGAPQASETYYVPAPPAGRTCWTFLPAVVCAVVPRVCSGAMCKCTKSLQGCCVQECQPPPHAAVCESASPSPRVQERGARPGPDERACCLWAGMRRKLRASPSPKQHCTPHAFFLHSLWAVGASWAVHSGLWVLYGLWAVREAARGEPYVNCPHPLASHATTCTPLASQSWSLGWQVIFSGAGEDGLRVNPKP